ncbi:hypothetical protein MNBD_GAMMA01-1671 [hydrothermal vent metagenome]|uniref:DUF4340 domain-containing protein n=1 Tax=hydrothermal vent metagenome TaxID=652676 RepID=A0A3B0VD10_9ZZZZ
MQNNFKILIAVLLILLGISYFVLQNDNSSHSASGNELLIPELQTQINAVDNIIISQNKKSISLSKQSGVWTILEADNFLADANKVASLLLDLRKFKLTAEKTNNPKSYAKLSLAETGENAAIRIVLKSADKQFADISIGKKAQKGQGTYVRKNSQTQTWLAAGSLDIKLDSKDWIVSTILDIDANKIKSVTFKPADSPALSINKLTPADESFLLENIPEQMQPKADADIASLATGLQKFSIESATLKPEDAIENLVVSITYQLFSGMIYRLDLFSYAQKHLLTISLENTGSGSEFDKQLENWLYVIPKFKFDALNKKLADFIENKSEQVQQDTNVENQD